MKREEELQKQGWEKRFIMDELRLSEAVAQYREIGFEVLLDPVDPASEECTSCLTDRYKTVYTRPKKEMGV
jgi:hypothetical protein